MKPFACFVFLGFLALSCSAPVSEKEKESFEKYEETWESLAAHNEAPDWFRDAKFGIYFHWGVYAVPAFGSEWYPRNMHFEHRKEYAHHIEKYGSLEEFGYHDFVPLFKAEKFDAKEWVSLFKKAGARFAGPVAEHHDGFSMWDSEVTSWNSMGKGPKRDILGELKKEIEANDMKLIATFHHARNLQRYKNQPEEKEFRHSHYPLFEGTAPSQDDSELNYLYGNIPEQKWEKEVWLGKLKEVVDKYEPDIMWFDSWLDQISEEKRKEFCAYYLNQAQTWDKEVVIVRKQDDLPLEVSVDDLEKSRKNELDEKVWMTDETVSTGSWCYTENLTIKPTKDLVHVLVDIVSKNGVLLLNVSPKADGTIPDDQKQALIGIGSWLDQHGEAIYGTKPWYTFGEGPTVEPEGHFKNHKEFLKVKYTSEDIRYTVKGSTIYATVLGSRSNAFTMKAFAKSNLKDALDIKNVSILGSDREVEWNYSDEGLTIAAGLELTNDIAQVLKIEI